jgi:3'(2'), 5'-bisphosphate nucleotidase
MMEKLIQTAISASIEAGKAIMKIYDTDFDIAYKEDSSPLTEADQASHEVISTYLQQTLIPILSEEGKHLPFEKRKRWEKFWLVDPLDGTKEFIKRNGEFTVNIALIENGISVAGIIYVPVAEVLYVGVRNLGAFKLNGAKDFRGTIEDLKKKAINLPEIKTKTEFRVVASRSHLSKETESFINRLNKTHENIQTVSKGSSLKLCLIAEGAADIYPRFAPTMEWDTAAGHAIVKAAGGKVVLADDEKTEVTYNKENLLNPWFIAEKGGWKA